MPALENVEIVKAYLATHDAKYMAEDALFHDYSQPEPIKGRAAIGAMLDMFYHSAFSEASAEARCITADDSRVVYEFTFHGINSGPFMDHPPTGKRVEVPMCAVYDVEGGMIREGRLYYDSALLGRQLGLL